MLVAYQNLYVGNYEMLFIILLEVCHVPLFSVLIFLKEMKSADTMTSPTSTAPYTLDDLYKIITLVDSLECKLSFLCLPFHSVTLLFDVQTILTIIVSDPLVSIVSFYNSFSAYPTNAVH